MGMAFEQKKQGLLSSWRLKWHRIVMAAKGFIYGMTYYDMTRHLYKQRGNLEQLFVLIVFGDMVGIPILPPYYSLRLLPFTVPMISSWKRSILRERDLTDLADLLGG